MVVIVARVIAGPEHATDQTGEQFFTPRAAFGSTATEATDASAVFPGDLLETKPGFSANLSLDGSTVLIQPESVAKFQEQPAGLGSRKCAGGDDEGHQGAGELHHRGSGVNEWTQYEVTDVNGNVQVAARKKDVNVERGRGSRGSQRREDRRHSRNYGS